MSEGKIKCFNNSKGGNSMLLKRNVYIGGIVICLFFFLGTLTYLHAADTTVQVITHIDEILKDNPLKADAKGQMIPIAQDDTVSLFLIRAIEGFILKPHYHKTHDETVYVIKGTGQMLINDKWVDIKPGSFHFNPSGMNRVHSIKHTGVEPLVVISIFTPGLKEPDRHFVE
jgi:mannose-6-phosphate isomerase-like protein (cupin superfamily)